MNTNTSNSELTGKVNRRHIIERLPSHKRTGRINKRSLSIITTDIGFLKEANDKCGHDNKEKILIDFYNLVLSSIRGNSGSVERWGKEKFIIILNNDNLQNAYIFAKKISRELKNTIFELCDVNISITSNISVYTSADYDIEISGELSKVDNTKFNAKIHCKNRTNINRVNMFGVRFVSISNRLTKLSILDNEINEMREILNEICHTFNQGEIRTDCLILSQYLDELIVEYMKETKKFK